MKDLSSLFEKSEDKSALALSILLSQVTSLTGEVRKLKAARPPKAEKKEWEDRVNEKIRMPRIPFDKSTPAGFPNSVSWDAYLRGKWKAWARLVDAGFDKFILTSSSRDTESRSS